MMNTTYRICLLLCSLASFAFFLPEAAMTGPSSIQSEIRPISINERGEILCRTRFMENLMGGHVEITVSYGYCVISKDSLVEFVSQVIDPDVLGNEAAYEKNTRFCDSLFGSRFDPDELDEVQLHIGENYVFEKANVMAYEIDKIRDIPSLDPAKQQAIAQIPQKALTGKESVSYYESQQVHIKYDFGYVVILENVYNDISHAQLGAEFSYENPWTSSEGNVENVGFDVSLITGVLYLK